MSSSIPHRDIADSPWARVDPFKSMDFDAVDEVMVDALARALDRWPGDLTRATADFRMAMAEMFRVMLKADIAAAYMRGVTSTIAYIIDLHTDRTFIADCIAFASNLHALQGGLSETAIAERHGVKRATVSKWVQIVRKDLDLPPPRGGRDDEAVGVYSERAHKVHGTEPKVQTSGIKIETAEALIGKLCRWLAGVQTDGLPPDQGDKFLAAVARFRDALFELEAAFPPPR